MTHTYAKSIPVWGGLTTMLSSKFERFHWLLVLVILVFGTSCSKHPIPANPHIPTPSETIVLDLKNMEIPEWGKIEIIDFNGDRFPEFIFEIKPIGDYINKQDKFKYNVKTTLLTELPINGNEEVPYFDYDSTIPLSKFGDYEWWAGAEITIMQKVVSVNNGTLWEGNWINVQKKYLPFKVLRPDGVYAGWLEISTSTQTEKAIIHRAGISKLANKPVKAGI